MHFFTANSLQSLTHKKNLRSWNRNLALSRSQRIASRWKQADNLHTHRGRERTLSGLHSSQMRDMPNRRDPSGSYIAGKPQRRSASGIWFAECDATAMPRCREGFRTVLVGYGQRVHGILTHEAPLTRF
jgi:hypothetical protein